MVLSYIASMLLPASSISLEGHVGLVSHIAFLPNENRVVTAGYDWKARVFDAYTGKLHTTFSEHEGGVDSIAVLGKDLIASGDCTGVLCIWRATTGKCLKKIYLDGEALWAMSVIDASKFVVSMGGGCLLFFEHCDGENVKLCHEVPNLQKDGSEICAIAIAAHDQRVVIGSIENTAQVWSVDTHMLQATLRKHSNEVEGVAMSDKHIVTTAGNTACSGTDAEVFLWDARSFVFQRRLECSSIGSIYSPLILNSKFVLTVTEDKFMKMSDMSTGDCVHKVKFDFSIWDVVAASDGRVAVSGSNSAVIFPAPQPIMSIIRGRTPSAALRLLGVRGGKSDEGYHSNSVQVKWWRAFAGLDS